MINVSVSQGLSYLQCYWYYIQKLHKTGVFQGYLIIKDFFTKEELEACRDDLEDEVDKLANKLYKAGKIKSKQHTPS